MSVEKPLRKMKVSEKGVVKRIETKGVLGRRIRDIGITPGVEIEIVGRAPLKDPVALKINGYILILRNSEADYIICEVNSE